MKIEFCNLKRQRFALREKIESRINQVFEHSKFVNGPEIKELEEKLRNFVGTKYAVGVSSGTDALLASLTAYNVSKEDYVITTPFTFFATAGTIAISGANPLFVDIDHRTFNLDPKKLERFLENPIGPGGKRIPIEKIKGIISTDLYGQSADYVGIKAALNGKDIFILEDGAQAFGAEYRGRKTCSLGDVAITSFFPAKPLGCYGDGGMVFTDNEKIAKKIELFRNHCQEGRYNHIDLGLNLRLDSIQAAVLLAKFEEFPSEVWKRNEVARKYNEGLRELEDRGKLVLPHIEEHNKSVYAQYSIKTNERNELKSFLEKIEIPTAIHYPKPLHLQTAFAYLGYKEGDFPVSEEISKKVISLPMCAYKDNGEIEYICEKIKQYFI